jgi:uncharacterized membrane protein
MCVRLDEWLKFGLELLILNKRDMQAMNTFTKMGLIGLSAQALINVVALLLFKKDAAQFFTDQWWSLWFPTYTVWLVFLIVGLAGGGQKKSSPDD